MEIGEVISRVSSILNQAVRQIILQEGLVKTGTMLNNTNVNVYIRKDYSISFTIVSTDYFEDVNNNRIKAGKKSIQRLLFESPQFKEAKEIIGKFILENKFKEVIKDIKQDIKRR